MKCAFCKYSVPVKNTPCFNCTYDADDSKRAEKCDETLQFMWMYNEKRNNRKEKQSDVYSVDKVINELKRFEFSGTNLSSFETGYNAGLSGAIAVIKAGKIE